MTRIQTYLLLLAFAGISSDLFAVTKTFSGTGNWSTPLNWSPSGAPANGDEVIINGTCTLTGSATCSTLTIGSTGSLAVGAQSLNVTGFTTVGGTLSDNNASGAITIGGLLTVTGTWNITVAQTVELKGGLTKSGTFNAGSGTYRFSTNSQAINGTVTFADILLITNNITITNNGYVTLTNSLTAWDASMSWINASGSTMRVSGDLMVTGTFNATAVNNTVIYDNSTTRVTKPTNYYHLTKSNTGTLTVGPCAILGNLTVNAGTFDCAAQSPNIDVDGNIEGTGGTLSFAWNSLNIGGTFSFSGTFTPGNCTITYDGASAQTLRPGTYQTITLSGSGVKSMGGDLTVTGTLNIGTSTLAINGYTLNIPTQLSGSGFIRGSSSSKMILSGNGYDISSLKMDQTSVSTATLAQLTVNKAWRNVTLASNLYISEVVTVTAGTLNSAGYLTLLSSASGDARVAAIPNSNGASLSGTVNIQKYINSGSRRWMHMGSPVSNFTWAQLQDDIFVTGTNGGGFDQNSTYFASVQTYIESAAGDCGPNGWVAPSNINNSVTASKGLKVFYRGDRDPARLANSNAPAPNAVTIDFTGSINSGTQNLNVTYTNNGNSNWDGWNFVANPYPSAIDWNAASGWTKTNVSGTIYVWNAAAGTYATWNGSSGTNGMSNGRIALGQGFWVKATAASPVLSMTEDVKTSTSTAGFFKGNAASPVNSFRVTMVKDEIVKDELLFNFDQSYSRSFEQNSDAAKLFNTSINLWAKSEEGKDLVINNYPSAIVNDTVVLGMTSSTEGIFNLEFDIDSIPSNISVLLIDSYRNRVVDVRKEKTWKVLINSEAASFATGRLKLVFISQSTTTLNLNASINAARKADVQWNSNQEINTAQYEIEHSTDGVSFENVGTHSIEDALILTASSYTFQHANPVVGVNYYRVKRVSTTGIVSYSDIAQVTMEEQNTTGINQLNGEEINVYPVPAQSVLNINLPSLNEEVRFEIINLNGAIMMSQSSHAFSTVTIDIQQLPAGIYFLKASSSSFSASRKIVKQ